MWSAPLSALPMIEIKSCFTPSDRLICIDSLEWLAADINLH